MGFNPGGDHTKGKKKYALGLRRIIRLKENAPEFDYSSFYGKTGAGNPLLCGAALAFLMTSAFALRSSRRQCSLPYFNFGFVCGAHMERRSISVHNPVTRSFT